MAVFFAIRVYNNIFLELVQGVWSDFFVLCNEKGGYGVENIKLISFFSSNRV